MKKLLFIILSAYLSSYICKANILCRKLDFASANGLMQSHISNAQQDKSGFMWFATWNGLIRYDGYKFHTFKPIQCSDGTIYSNRIYNIKMSGIGNIWCVSSDNRLFLFNTSTCKFSDVQKDIRFINNKKVKVLTPLKNGKTWVTFKDFSCIQLNDASPTKGYKYFSVGSKSLLGHHEIYSISLDERGEEWILTDRGAINMTRGMSIKGKFRHVHNISGATLLTGSDGMIMKIDNNGKRSCHKLAGNDKIKINYVTSTGSKLICATDKGLLSFDAHTGGIMRYGKAIPYIYTFKDSQKRIWTFGKDNTVNLIADVNVPQAKTLRTLTAPASEQMKNPQLIFEDNNHNIILKPCKGVLSYYDENSGTLKECPFYTNNGYETYAPVDIKKYLVDHDRNLWVFHSNNVDCISFSPTYFMHRNNPYGQETRAMTTDAMKRYWITDRTNAVRVLNKNSEIIGYLTGQGTLNKQHTVFSGMPMYCIKESPSNDIWIGTKGEGVYILRPRNKERTSYDITHLSYKAHDNTSLRSDSIYDIAFIDRKVYMASYGNGLSVGEYTGKKWIFKRIKNQPAGMKIRCIVNAGNGILILGTADGLVTADIKNLETPHFYINKYRNEKWGLKGNDIMKIVKCNGKFYACVFGSGISRIDSENLLSNELHFTNYIIPSSGTADQIKTAIADNSCIWIVSEQSITSFFTETGQHRTYTKSNFIGDFSFSEASPVICNGDITIGTSTGTLSFSNKEIISNDSKKHISVTGIRYQNDITIHPLNDISHLEIQPEQRSFSIYLSSMEYDGHKEERRFRYRLEGQDKGWNYAQEYQPVVIYNRLPPGKYKLIIEATGDNGQWGDTKRIIDIEVVPLFTETIWFRLFLILLAAAVISGMAYAIVHFRRMKNLIQKKYSLLMTIDELSSKFSSVKETPLPQTDKDDKNRLFIEKSTSFLNENIYNPNIVIEDFARHLGMSRTAFYNKMKQITGLSPVDFIKQVRIKKALKLLDEGTLSITEIAYKVGFADPKYFSRCFKAEMNMTPTQYIGRRKTHDTTL